MNMSVNIVILATVLVGSRFAFSVSGFVLNEKDSSIKLSDKDLSSGTFIKEQQT